MRPLAYFQQRSDVKHAGFETECWLWLGVTERGYGRVSIDGRQFKSHRAAYISAGRDLPSGLVIDHICRNRSCCNPDHLEAVTQRENVQRGESPRLAGARMRAKTHCPKGHEYTPDNLIARANGWRQCRECNRLSCQRRRSAEAGNLAPEGLRA